MISQQTFKKYFRSHIMAIREDLILNKDIRENTQAATAS